MRQKTLFPVWPDQPMDSPNIDTFNPVRIAFHEWCDILKDVRHSKSAEQAFQYTFGLPGQRTAKTVFKDQVKSSRPNSEMP